jgi:hypothetical protein
MSAKLFLKHPCTPSLQAEFWVITPLAHRNSADVSGEQVTFTFTFRIE